MNAIHSTVERIPELIANISTDRHAVDVRLGLRYNCVLLDDGSCGVAYRFPEGKCGPDWTSPDDGRIAGRKASELLSWLRLEHLLQRSVGLATANALIKAPRNEVVNGDVLAIIEFRPGEKVVMVGYFEPLVPFIQDKCALKIFEIDTSLASGLNESSSAFEGLKHGDVALITSTALINGTLDHLLRCATGCREVVILGPSTPLLPQAFAGTPVTLLSGVEVVDKTEILRTISEGGGMKNFKPYVRKINLRIKQKQ